MNKKHIFASLALSSTAIFAFAPMSELVVEASTPSVNATIYSVNGINVSLDFDTFTQALNAGVLNDLNIKYIQIGTSYYSFDTFTSALNAFNTLDEAITTLTSNSSLSTALTKVTVGTVDVNTGGIIGNNTAVTEEFKIISIY